MQATSTGPRATARATPRFAIIGAGMSGILTAITLKNRGLTDFTVYEKAGALGGTWRDNTYPGLACDVPSIVYAYSFELKPDWTRHFSPGGEIQAYFESVARKYDVERFIRFNSEIEVAAYRDARWHLRTADGHADVVDVVISATGVLHHPSYPDIEGLESFDGPCFHTARWDHSHSYAGKRVGIIGTGSTAIQIVPAIVDSVAKVSLFQRTPQWVLGMPNPAYTDDERRMFRESPDYLRQSYLHLGKRFIDGFSRAVIGDEVELKRIEDACRENLETNVRDPDLKRRLTPNYKAACKRLIVSDTFYPAIQRPNAELVSEGIERIEPKGVRTRDGRLHELDMLVLATGFHAHSFMRPMNVIGKDGVTLEQAWADSVTAYRSVAMPGFPNFFMLIGPNSPVGNFPLIMISELQLNYILQLVDLIRTGEAAEIAPSVAATERFNEAIRKAMVGTVWMSGCSSWYLDRNGNAALWPWTFDRFQDEMQRPDLRDFDLVA